MAAGFKTATVNASDVPATQTNFPAYVDLSRLGITTLAEAQSVRVYADSGKTTEWAREIVSATEMHVKIPSLTSTTEIYVDWDGSRADYAATDTYGRNAVWSDYRAVYHFNDANDSTSNARNGSGVNTPTYTTGKLGNALTLVSASSQYVSMPNSLFPWGTNTYYFNIWVKFSATTGNQSISMTARTGQGAIFYLSSPNITNSKPNASDLVYNWAGRDTNWHMWTFVGTGSGMRTYLDGNSTPVATNVNTGNITAPGSDTIEFGAYRAGGTIQSGWYMGGQQDEARVRGTVPSTSWITTEYNNQSDEATFWGTWSDAGGGGANTTNFFQFF